MNNRDINIGDTNIDDLPDEMLVEIFSQRNRVNDMPVLLSDMPVLSRVSKKFRRAASDNMAWKVKFKRHFPHRFEEISSQTGINWHLEFFKYRRQEYKPLSQKCRKVFSLTNEADIEQLKLILKFSHFTKRDRHDVSLVKLARRQNNQALLDLFYEVAGKFYTQTQSQDLDITKVDAQKGTLLHWAVLLRQNDLIDFLIEKGINIEAISLSGANALSIAVQDNNAIIVEKLIKKHANIEVVSMWGSTPLFHAIEKGYQAVVDILLKYHADVNAPLRKGANTYQNLFPGDTPLLAAIKLKRTDIVPLLLENGAYMETASSTTGRNPLRLFVEQNDVAGVELLLERGANIDALSSAGATALLLAIELGHLRIIDTLLLHKADVNIPLKLNVPYHKQYDVVAGDTPLIVAIKRGNKNLVPVLLDKGADINAKASDGRSAFSIAVEKGDVELARLLTKRKRKTDIDISMHDNTSPLIYAINHCDQGMIDFLAENNTERQLTRKIIYDINGMIRKLRESSCCSPFPGSAEIKINLLNKLIKLLISPSYCLSEMNKFPVTFKEIFDFWRNEKLYRNTSGIEISTFHVLNIRRNFFSQIFCDNISGTTTGDAIKQLAKYFIAIPAFSASLDPALKAGQDSRRLG